MLVRRQPLLGRVGLPNLRIHKISRAQDDAGQSPSNLEDLHVLNDGETPMSYTLWASADPHAAFLQISSLDEVVTPL